MFHVLLKAALLLALPAVVFVAGAAIMSKAGGRDEVVQQLRDRVAPEDARFLNLRIAGYDREAVARHWGALDHHARASARHLLELDLVFPFFYGAAFVVALLLAWVLLDRPFHPAWLMAPVVITVLADWVENLVQLGQLQRFVDNGANALQAGWIAVASLATSLKLGFFIATSLLLIGLTVRMVARTLFATHTGN